MHVHCTFIYQGLLGGICHFLLLGFDDVVSLPVGVVKGKNAKIDDEGDGECAAENTAKECAKDLTAAHHSHFELDNLHHLIQTCR